MRYCALLIGIVNLAFCLLVGDSFAYNTRSRNSGVSMRNFNPSDVSDDLILNDDINLSFGAPDVCMAWETEGNDNFQIGTAVGAATSSGYVGIMEYADMGNANRSPSGTNANPILRVYSADEAQANDYIELYHDQTRANIVSAGQIELDSASTFYLDSLSGLYVFKDNETDLLTIRMDTTTDQSGVFPSDGAGNQLIIANSAYASSDFDHIAATNPTLYIQSDEDPDTDNTQYQALSHDKSNAVVEIGEGSLERQVAGVSVNDEASISLPDSASGWGFVQVGDGQEYALFSFTSAAVVTLVSNSANVVNTDTDTNLCIFDGGTSVTIKNRLGSDEIVRYEINHS